MRFTIDYRFVILIPAVTLAMLTSCNFLQIDPPDNKIPKVTVFADEASASSAMAGVYLTLYLGENFASGDATSVTALTGLSADELHNYPASNSQLTDFENNHLRADNAYVNSLWASMYKCVYQVNAVLEGVENSTSLSSEFSNQLRGEALFVRAFCHFYLTNCFGEVPIVVTTDYKVNNTLSRSSVTQIYNQIESDLLEAEALLNESYLTDGKVRPNKYTVTAMLARLYLYKKDWARAEDKATSVIARTALYTMPEDLNSVFLSTSSEAIWQLKPQDLISHTNEGATFLSLAHNVLAPAVVSAFEPSDKRLLNWVKSTNGASPYFVYKYKLSFITNVESNEYSTVFRLAEQHLIRAEARAQQPGKLSQAIADVDVIRSRAGLTLIQNTNPGISKDNLLLAIEHERRLELFAEWGHRWFDLKRTGRATAVLGPIKADWAEDDQLYPIPAIEIRNNKNLAPQNSGY